MTYTDISNKQFEAISQLVYEEVGIHLTDQKRSLLSARLLKCLRNKNMNTDQYLQLIQKDPDERKVFLNAISTNHTFFFRESRPFKYLKPNQKRIWCAASSSGEEPYSIAMICAENNFTPSIWATDISTDCLKKGENGVYPMDRSTQISKERLKRFFQKGKGSWEGYIRVKSSLRSIIEFSRFNLLKDTPPRTPFDIIFCRNVMIYFDKPTKEKVVHKLITALKPNGHFIIGGAESLSGLNHPLKYIEPSVYQL